MSSTILEPPRDPAAHKELLMARYACFIAFVAFTFATPLTAAARQKDIVDTAVGAGSFKILAQLLTDAGLVPQMKGPGPYTVFAPTDEAFAKVPKATLDALGKDKAKLAEVLKYHVLTSSWTSADVKSVKSAGTAQGKSIAVTSVGGLITLNGSAKVVKADVKASNGVIHVIDAVLLPPQ